MQSLIIKGKTKKRKVNAPFYRNSTSQKKVSVLQGEDKSKKKKANMTEEWKWEDKEKQSYDEKGMYFRGRGTRQS